jgi:hypothetical protein
VVSFTPLPLYPGRKSLRYPLDKVLVGPQNRSGRYGEVNILDPTGTRLPTTRSSSPYPVAIPTAPPWLIISFEYYWSKNNRAGVYTVAILYFYSICRVHCSQKLVIPSLTVTPLRSIYNTEGCIQKGIWPLYIRHCIASHCFFITAIKFL